jgi:hypothetical protein
MATKTNPASLQTAIWNARGTLIIDKGEIINFLSKHDIDILLVSETHLKPTSRIRFPNYTTYRTDRPTNRGGGTAIFIKSHIDHCEAPPTTQSRALESCSIIVNTRSSGSVKFTSVYVPPFKKDDSITRTDLDSLLDTNVTSVVIAGDFNAKHLAWGGRSSDFRGKMIYEFTDDNNITLAAPSEPTHYPANNTHQPSILDFALLAETDFIHEISVVNELSSDHKPVLLHLGDPSNVVLAINRRIRTQTSWEDFKSSLEEKLTQPTLLNTEESIDSAVATFTGEILDAVNAATVVRPSNHTLRPDISQRLKDKIREKNKARLEWQKQKLRASKTIYNRLIPEIRKELAELDDASWCQKVNNLVKGSPPYWSLTKLLRQTRQKITHIQGPNGPVYSSIDKAEAFAVSIAKQFSPNTIDRNNSEIVNHVRQITRKARDIYNKRSDPPPNPLTPATVTEIGCLIKWLNNRKAPGNDGLTNRAVKNLPDRGIEILTQIVNASLELQYFPAAWKVADIVLIPKPGKDLTCPENHRPISLLPTLSKIFERVIKRRLQIMIDEADLIPEIQHGFRAGHSTNHQLLRVIEYITKAFNYKTFTTGLFLDIAKAFDKVWIKGLIVKLSESGLDTAMINMISSFLRNRSFNVKLNGIRSTTKIPTAGVPQGSVLGPTLYNLYTKDIPIPTDSYGSSTIVAQYADDTAILSKSLNLNKAIMQVQTAANQISNWCDKWRIQINPAKSAAIHFARHTNRHRLKMINLKMHNHIIPWDKSVKYLGLTIVNKLTFNKHILEKKRQAVIVNARLRPMMGPKSKLSTRAKLLLYTAITRPTITYASPIWAYSNPRHIKLFQTIQNKTLRRITGAPWYVRNTTLHRDLNVETIHDHIMKLSKRFYKSMINHPNASIKNLLIENGSDTDYVYRRPKAILLDKHPP